MLRSAKRSYVKRLESADAKQFWSAIKNLNGWPSSSMPTLEHLGEVANSDSKKAEMLSKYFSTCFNHTAPNLPATTVQPPGTPA